MSRAVREAVQVELASDDSALLKRLAKETGLSKAEILRQGVRSYAREYGADRQRPMLKFLSTITESGPPSVVAGRDKPRAEAQAPRKKRR